MSFDFRDDLSGDRGEGSEPDRDGVEPGGIDPAESDTASRMPDWMTLFFRTDMSPGRYVLRMAVISFVPTALFGALLGALGFVSEDNAPQFAGPPLLLFLGIVLFSPMVETLLMSAIFGILSLFTRSPLTLALVSVVIWTALHSLAAPIWGLVIAWPFFVFSCAYLAWRRISWTRAVGVTCGIHSLHNLIPALAVLWS